MKNIPLTILTVLVLMSISITAKVNLPSEKIYPHLNKIYKKGWIDLNKNNRKDIYEDPSQPIERRIDDLLKQMNIEEKAGQLVTYYGYKKVLTDSIPTQRWMNTVLKHGVANIDEHLNGEIYDLDRLTTCMNETQRFFIEYTRLGIPVDFTNEGIRGLTAPGATSFPSMNGLGCTWNRSLAYTMGKIEGSEARAMGYTNVYAPILDVARDQRWGRWEGSISEDPFLVAELGVAMARGIQDQKVVSSPKHYVGYGDCKAARQWDARTDPHITPSEMYYIHEYPFRRVFKEAGALGVMCAYNDYNGIPIAGNYHYLTEVLREEMGFKGYVVSDSYAIGRMDGIHKTTHNGKESCLKALLAGLNVRTEFNTPDQYAQWICELVAEGKLPEKRIDELVGHVLYVKFWLGLFDNPYPANPQTAHDNVATPANLQSALDASRQCLVLLKNQDATLPLGNKYKKIAVVGPNAKSRAYIPTHYGPRGYGNYVSVFDGIKNIYKDTDISVEYAKGIDHVNKGWPENELIDDTLTTAEQNDIAQAVTLAKNSDIVIAVMGV